MKKLLALLIVGSTLALHGAGCTSCAQRRAQVMANRRPAEKAFPKHLEEISEYDDLLEQFENGKYAKFLEKQQKATLNAMKTPSYKRFLAHRSQLKTASLYHFGVPSLLFFTDLPSSLMELKLERGTKLIALLEENEDTYLEPMLKCLGTFSFSESQISALQTLSKLRRLSEEEASDLENTLIKIEQEFLVMQQVFNNGFMRGQSIDVKRAGKLIAVLELEMIRQMHEACVEAQDEELASQFKTIQSMIIPMTKVLRWEKVLQMLAARSYKLPGMIEKNVVEIQNEYNEKKSGMMREYMELALY
ncbi:MAG: hypothetical protein H7A40_03970 [Chlamydiales bacterium]|nr:hypothetical protein [Chlamydiales bacterium]